MHRTIIALALALGALALPAAAAHAEDPQWIRWNAHLHVEVTQDTGWEYHDEFADSCSSNWLKVDGDGEETLQARTKPGDSPISIYQHVKTGETYIASSLGYPSGEGNSLMLKASGSTIRQGRVDTTVIGDDEPKCGGSDEEPPPPPARDCGLKRHPLYLKIRFNGAFENTTVRNAFDQFADPLYKNCPNYAPIKSPNLILEFKRKQVNEGAVDSTTWFYSITGEAKQRTETSSLTAITRLHWRALIYRYGDWHWVAGPGEPMPVPGPGERSAGTSERIEIPNPPLPAAQPAPARAAKKARRRAKKTRSRRSAWLAR